MVPDNFTTIEFTTANLDRYFIRQSILKAINSSLTYFNGSLLDIGCGKMPYKEHIFQNSTIKEYIGLDIENALLYDESVNPDFTWNGKTMPFENDQFETAFATEVLEHCAYPQIILKELYRVLKPAGVFFFTVPFLWPLHEVPHDEYRYTPFALTRLLEEAGFKNISIKATGGWHASLAQMLGLWVRRAPLTKRQKKYLSFIFKPVIKRLLKWEKYSTVDFKESQMITGLYGTAYK